jgi:hypothetical protein
VVPETPEEKRRWEAGRKRREERLRLVAMAKKDETSSARP